MNRSRKNKKITPTDLKCSSLEEWLAQEEKKELLRFITCGSVDDGKSTLIGRLLWESMQVFEDQYAALEQDSKRHGTQGKDIDFALLVDGLTAEREQGITIDVAYRFFSTSQRKYIVADTPGHEQYTRNMVTGASTADAAVILIDAKRGVMVQTRRHAYVASLLGIKTIVVAINKMDLMGYKEEVYSSISIEFSKLARSLNFEAVTIIPTSALRGENITLRSANMPWYQGPTLIGCLDTIKVQEMNSAKMVFPVQLVNRPNPDFRGYCGTLCSGQISVGDQLRVTRSGQVGVVEKIITVDGEREKSESGDAITIVMDREIDVSRGDIVSNSGNPLEMTDQFEAVLVWMDSESGHVGRSYEFKLSTQCATASITNIKHKIDVNTQSKAPSKNIELNDISVVNVAVSRPVVFQAYAQSRELGGFILIDKFSHATVAAGLIQHNLRRSQNIYQQAMSINRLERERQNGHKAKVIWFTGLSGSGKSTLANALEKELHKQGKRTYILDGDNIRQGLNKDLGFTDADRVENIRRVAEVAKLMFDAGQIVIVSFISPFKAERYMAKQLIGEGNFFEVFLDVSLEICEKRDPKGLYKKARSGHIPNMTGINSPYERPEHPDYVIETDKMDITESVKRLIEMLD